MLDKLLKGMVDILQVLMGLIILVMTVSNIIQIVTRYFISYQVMWVEDVSIFGLYWIFAFGMPMAWIIGAHLDMNAFENLMSAGFKRFLWLIQQIVGIGAGIGLIYTGKCCIDANKGFIMSIIGVDEMWRYVPLVVAGVLLLIAIALLLAKAIVDKSQGKELPTL